MGKSIDTGQTWPVAQGRLPACDGCPVARATCVWPGSAMVKTVRRWGRQLVRANELRCAREDAHVRNLVVPHGVWACHACPHVSLNLVSFKNHLADVHA
jgi:hypothetical protein